MNLNDLLKDLTDGDPVDVNQRLKDAKRNGWDWSKTLAPPQEASLQYQALYAALVEMFCERENRAPPAWIPSVGVSPEEVVFFPGKNTEKFRPLASKTLRKWNVLAPPEHLDVL